MWNMLRDEVRRHHSLFDQQIQEWIQSYSGKGGKIHCANGCRNCCNLAVNCTFTEAMCIAEAVTEAQHRIISQRAQTLLRMTEGISDLKSYLRMHREIGFCPFLDENGSCSIYFIRPFSCRSLLSTVDNIWCGADFSTLSSEEKQAYIEGLDRNTVSFPVHYVAATQEIGQAFEGIAMEKMSQVLGFSLSGNLPYLVWLEREHNLYNLLSAGYDNTLYELKRQGLYSPYLLMFNVPQE